MDGKSKKCLIIVGGEYAPFKEHISFDCIIACDRGYEYADRMGIAYDIVMGDFDSAASQPVKTVPVIRLPVEKDDTDTYYAVKHALKQGYDDLYIICAFGGRLDHTLANIQTARYIAENNAIGHLYGVGNELHCFKNSQFSFKKRENSYISVFSLSDVSEGVTISGAKYNTDHCVMTGSFPLGVSNEWSSDTVSVSVENGVLAVIVSSEM